MVKGQTIKWSNGQSGGDGTRWIADRLAVVAVLTTCFLFSLFALAAVGCKTSPAEMVKMVKMVKMVETAGRDRAGRGLERDKIKIR